MMAEENKNCRVQVADNSKDVVQWWFMAQLENFSWVVTGGRETPRQEEDWVDWINWVVKSPSRYFGLGVL